MADPLRKIEMLLKKAWTLVEAGQVDLGLAAFDDAITVAPKDDGLMLEKGVALFRAGRFEPALACFETALALNPANAVARTNAAKSLARLGRRADAAQVFEAGLALEPESFALLLGSGALAHEDGRPDEAIARFERAAAAKPREGEPWYRMGLALRAKREVDRALAAFVEACTRRPKYMDALQERARALRELGRPKEAWIQVIEAVKVSGDGSTIEFLAIAAEIALDLGNGADALRCSEKAIEKSQDAARAWALKARAHDKLGQAAKAALAEGTGLMIEGRLEQALAALDRSVASDPRYTAAYCNRAVVLERLGRLDEAVRSYDRALEVEPGAVAVWHNKANLLWGKLDRKAEAIACYRREIKLDPRRWFDLPPAVRAEVDQA